VSKSVAIVGEFASGKTTLANALIEQYGFKRVSFAGRLKQMAAAVYAPSGNPAGYGVVEKTAEYEVFPLRWDDPGTISGREVLQQLGQSVKELDRLFWVRWLMNDIDAGMHGDGPFVTDDCRFPYEADALRERGFTIVRVMTPIKTRMERYEMTYGRLPTQAEMTHPSETEVTLIDWDMLVDGTHPVDELASTIAGELAKAA
jgi:hypothetical protein